MPKANFRIKTREEFIRDGEMNRSGTMPKHAHIPIGCEKKFYGRKIYLTEWDRKRDKSYNHYRSAGRYTDITFRKEHLVPIDTPTRNQRDYECY